MTSDPNHGNLESGQRPEETQEELAAAQQGEQPLEGDATPAEAGESASSESESGDVEAVEEEITAEAASEEADVDDEVEEDEGPVGHVEPLELVTEPSDDEIEHRWYILKVASNREGSIADALRRRIKIEGLEKFFGEIIVPTEDVAEFKAGKKRIVKRKLYPGYICVSMHINDDTWFLVRETPGIGDFTGAAGKPTPMLPHEVERILPKPEGHEEEKVKFGIPFHVNDKVRIKEGTFENFEGEVEGVDEANGRVTVVINIFDRPTPVEIDHHQLEAV